MKAVVFHDIGDIRWDDVPDPTIQQPTDAIVRVTTTALCGTDLHMIRGTLPGMKPGTILGHEGVGVVEEVGSSVRGLSRGDRVVIASTVGCGYCSYCRAGYYAQCDVANPNGSADGTCFFGGPESTGPVNGLQAEYARVPYAMTTLVPVPDGVADDDAIITSDIFPTGWFGARLAEVSPGDTVAIFGAGVVGQLALLSAQRQGAGRVIVVDQLESRLAIAQAQHGEIVNFTEDDPVETIRELTGGIGVDRVIDAVGVDAERPTNGPAAEAADKQTDQFAAEVAQAAPDAHPRGGRWQPGDAPSQAARWAVDAVAKAGTIGIIGVYPPTFETYPIGAAMNKNLTIRMGNCNHRRYIPRLLDLIAAGVVSPAEFITQTPDPDSIIDAYESFDARTDGWLKAVLPLS